MALLRGRDSSHDLATGLAAGVAGSRALLNIWSTPEALRGLKLPPLPLVPGPACTSALLQGPQGFLGGHLPVLPRGKQQGGESLLQLGWILGALCHKTQHGTTSTSWAGGSKQRGASLCAQGLLLLSPGDAQGSSSRTRNETPVCRGPWAVPTPAGAARCRPRAGAARCTAGFPKSPLPSGASPRAVGLLCTWGRGVQEIWGLCSPSRATPLGDAG